MIEENLALCLKRISAAALRAHRDPSGVTLVGVTKGVDAVRVQQALSAGVGHIGENRIQEALSKYDGLNNTARSSGSTLSWHMIGHLQTNKAKDAVRLFDMIHSVDSVRLAEEIGKEAAKINKRQEILLEVNVSGEESKYGFFSDDVKAALERMKGFSHLQVRGLMTVAPIVDDPEKTRPFFRKLRELAFNLFVHRPSSIDYRPFLSMGMTDDFEVAVEEGATHVRIGRGIFGER